MNLRSRRFASRRCRHDGDRTRREAGQERVCAARQDDRHAGPEHNSGGVSLGQEGQALCEHVAGLEVRNDENFARPATGDAIFLIAAASGLIALSSASGPSRSAPVI